MGYCRFIHGYLEQNPVDRLLFFSRDGFLLRKLYCFLYPEERHKTAYARWSRTAALKITAGYYKSEYFHRFLVCKAHGDFSISQILDGMDLLPLLFPLCEDLSLTPDEKLTHKNLLKVKGYLLNRWDTVLFQYADQVEAAGRYYAHLLQGCRRAAAVDLGWAGSGAVMLDMAVNRIWGLNCPVTGLLGGSLPRLVGRGFF